MAITVSINPANGNIKFNETQKLTAVVAGAPVDSTIDYTWKVDGAPVQSDEGSKGLSITVQGDKVGTKVVSLTVKATSDGEPETADATANVVIAKAEQTPFTATLTVTPETGEVGDTLKAKVVVSEPMDVQLSHTNGLQERQPPRLIMLQMHPVNLLSSVTLPRLWRIMST